METGRPTNEWKNQVPHNKANPKEKEQQGYHIGLQQATMYREDNGISCDEQINNIDPDQVN
jgi:hypothetical protein